MNISVLPQNEVYQIKIDCDQDIIPITVGMYKFFMQAGPEGKQAKDLYEHLIFTARLQATQQVRANNIYLAKGLGWGQAKVKQAKAWLNNAGLIEYVRARKDNGLLGEVYIRLRYLPKSSTVAERLEEDTDEYVELTPDLFESESAAEDDLTTGSETDPLVTTGSAIHPVVNHTHGSEQQMLKVNNEMLKVKKGKGESPPPESPHFKIPETWFREYSRITAIMISPRPQDYKIAAELYNAIGGDLSSLDLAIESYFKKFRELDLWFAAKKSSRNGNHDEWIPDYSFRSFVAYYPEIVAAALTKKPDTTKAVTEKKICPVCGSAFLGTMATCGKCGMSRDDCTDQEKIDEHRDWYESSVIKKEKTEALL